MTAQSDEQLHGDLRPFQVFAPVPPMLAEAIGYSGTVFGVPLDARWVGFYWEQSGDEAMYDDGHSSGTGEYTGFQAFVEHQKVAVHLCDYQVGSSETHPRHYLLLDRTEQCLYALPARLAQRFLQLQWQEQSHASETSPILPVESVDELLSTLNFDTWQEVKPPEDINERMMAAMQRQGQLTNELVTWLNEQQKPMTSERIAEYEPHAPAMLLRHVFDSSAFVRMGELVQIQEVLTSGDQVTITFERDNGIDGPDGEHLFSVNGSWTDIGEILEPLLEPGTLDDLLASDASLDDVFGRYVVWNGHAFPIVPMLDTLAIRVSLPCAKCERNPTTAFARSGLHRGAFCYVYDASGTFLADLRNQEYVCPSCERVRSDVAPSPVEGTQEEKNGGHS